MIFLKKFATTSDYDSYVATDYPKPNVSYVVAGTSVHFTPSPYSVN